MALFFIAVGSVYGAAEIVSKKVEDFLVNAGHSVIDVTDNPKEYYAGINDGVLLVITSTTGSGDLPDSIDSFYSSLQSAPPRFDRLRYGIIALGDSCYGDTYCGAGRQFDEMLAGIGGKRLGDVLKLDASETFEPEKDALAWLPEWLDQHV